MTPIRSVLNSMWSERVLTFMVVSFIVGMPQIIRSLLILNYDWGNLRFMRLYAEVIPFLFVVGRCVYNKIPFRMPHIRIFCIYIAMLFFLEWLPWRGAGERIYEFYTFQIEIYFLFLLLVNLDSAKKNMRGILGYALISWGIVCVVTYLGFMGVLKEGFVNPRFLAGVSGRKWMHVGHVNVVSFKCAFMTLLGMIYVFQEDVKMIQKALALALMVLCGGVIFVHASRAASGVYVVALLYGMHRWMRGKGVSAAVFWIAVYVLANLLLYVLWPWLLTLELFERILWVLYRPGGLRLVNFANAWRNFVEHPIVGVGYYFAAKYAGSGTRSNNQFLQTMAASGVLGLVCLLWYNFRMLFCVVRGMFKSDLLILAVTYAIFLCFRKPFEPLALFAYMAVCMCSDKRSVL